MLCLMPAVGRILNLSHRSALCAVSQRPQFALAKPDKLIGGLAISHCSPARPSPLSVAQAVLELDFVARIC